LIFTADEGKLNLQQRRILQKTSPRDLKKSEDLFRISNHFDSIENSPDPIGFLPEAEFSQKLTIDDAWALDNSKSLADRDRTGKVHGETKIFSEYQDDESNARFHHSKVDSIGRPNGDTGDSKILQGSPQDQHNSTSPLIILNSEPQSNDSPSKPPRHSVPTSAQKTPHESRRDAQSDTIIELLELSKDTADWKEINQVIYYLENDKKIAQNKSNDVLVCTFELSKETSRISRSEILGSPKKSPKSHFSRSKKSVVTPCKVEAA
jgi:hypothetical protein